MGRRFSLTLKFFAVFSLTMLLAGGSFFASLTILHAKISRNEARAVADQVTAFRSWIAQNGMVWVRQLPAGFHDYLEKQEGRLPGSFFYGKNPALATRELAAVVRREGSRAIFRVTSDNCRKKDNEPDAFERAAVARFKQDKALAFIEEMCDGGSYRYAQPLLVEQGCLLCHGAPGDAPKAVVEKYGKEKAFGYKVGQVRGIISVTLPALSAGELLRPLVNPYAAILLGAAITLNILFARSVLLRLTALTRNVEAIAAGKLEIELLYINPSESGDELDHLHHAISLLRRSLIVLFKRANRKE